MKDDKTRTERQKAGCGLMMVLSFQALRSLTEKIIGVFYEVYNELGFGFLEIGLSGGVCGLRWGRLGYRLELKFRFRYSFRGRRGWECFELTLLSMDCVLVELKATASRLTRRMRRRCCIICGRTTM